MTIACNSNIQFITDTPWTEKIRDRISTAWRFSVRILNNHTDLISSGGILIITTCLLAAKIFKNIPPLLSRLALAVFNFGGIIWLNVQVRDFMKSFHDLVRVIQNRDAMRCIEVAAKVFLKGTNILLTCAIFGASVVAAIGFPQLLAMLYLTTRPLALTSLAMTILTDIYDYFANRRLIHQMVKIESQPNAGEQIAKVISSFLTTILPNKSIEPISNANDNTERKLASHLVQQLDMFTLETFQESLTKNPENTSGRLNLYKLFFKVKECMVNKQAMTKSSLSLTALGYISMGVCKGFPDSVIEMSTRWTMSILYTDDLISQKLFQYDLGKSINV